MVANLGVSPSESLTLLLSVAPIPRKHDVYQECPVASVQAQYCKAAPISACRDFAEQINRGTFF